MNRVLICGDRHWNDAVTVEKVIITFDAGTLVIHGGAKGADSMAGVMAVRHGYDIRVFPAAWGTYGRRAGPIRNQVMLDKGKPDAVIWFHSNIEMSKGTRDMVRRAEKAMLPVFSHHEWLEEVDHADLSNEALRSVWRLLRSDTP
jgi:hypothetical protein